MVAARTPGIPSRHPGLEPGVPRVAGWDKIHAVQLDGGYGLATERRQAQRHSRVTPTAATRASGCVRKDIAPRPTQTTHQVCVFRSASFGEAARRGMDLARRAAGAACVGACAGMTSCIPAWAPASELPCNMVDRSRGHKACHVRPMRCPVSLWVQAQGHMCMGRHIQVQVQVVRKSFEGEEEGNARGARPLA